MISASDALYKLFVETIEKYRLITDEKKILLALSGGPDSTLLFHQL